MPLEELKDAGPRKAGGEAEMTPLARSDTFRFACHPGVPCFTECCRNLNLVLAPYDLLRLKKALRVGSKELLSLYTDQKPGNAPPMPMVYLRMAQNEERSCPFVTPEGCTIYEDRPTPCRLYPVGRGAGRDKTQMFFTIKEPHCRGFEESRGWTLDEWVADQGLKRYTFMNDLWTEVVMDRRFPRMMSETPKKYQMFFLASYSLDMFREFVFGSRFLEMFSFPEELVEPWREDDDALLVLAMKWLRFSILGEMSLDIRDEVARARKALLGMPMKGGPV